MTCIRCRALPSLLIAVAAINLCAAASAETGHHWQQTSDLSRFEAQPERLDEQVKVGEFQHWILHLQDSDGPITQAGIRVGGGMQVHGFGMPFQPVVSAYLGNGRYRIEGVKLNMDGRWTLFLYLETETWQDRVVFEIDIGSIPPEKENLVPPEGAFEVNGLRDVAATAPCLHDGRLVDPESVLAFYRHPPDKEQGRQHELPELDVTDAESRLPEQFLKSVSVVRD